MLKRLVFNARRKEGCESMSLMSVGRLFLLPLGNAHNITRTTQFAVAATNHSALSSDETRSELR